MDEQKYYVKLKEDVNFKVGKDCYDQDTYSYDFMWLDIDHELYPKRYRYPFTKTELSKIMDGALYSPRVYGQVIDGKPIIVKDEWINPLIELVSVEEEK